MLCSFFTSSHHPYFISRISVRNLGSRCFHKRQQETLCTVPAHHTNHHLLPVDPWTAYRQRREWNLKMWLIWKDLTLQIPPIFFLDADCDRIIWKYFKAPPNVKNTVLQQTFDICKSINDTSRFQSWPDWYSIEEEKASDEFNKYTSIMFITCIKEPATAAFKAWIDLAPSESLVRCHINQTLLYVLMFSNRATMTTIGHVRAICHFYISFHW